MSSGQRQSDLLQKIKSLQLKNHTLKRELSSLQTQRQQNIYEALQKQKTILKQKDITISFLQQQLNRLKQLHQIQLTTKRKQLQEMIQMNVSQRNKRSAGLQHEELVIEQLQRLQNQCRQKQREIDKWKAVFQHSQQQKRIYLQQIEKMNRFYQECRIQIPSKEETLLWVDKLIEFMGKVNNIVVNQSKGKEMLADNMGNYFKQELRQMAHEFSKNQSSLQTQKNKFLIEIKNLTNTAFLDYQQALKSNELFWQKFAKIKNDQEKNEIKQLENELKNKTLNFQKQKSELQESIRELQKQNKNLLINFQEMKNLFELKQKSSKEQVDFLKKEIEQLLAKQDERQLFYERSLKKIGQSMENILFRNKEEAVFNDLQAKIKEQFAKIKKVMDKMNKQHNAREQMKTFQGTIIKYLVFSNEQKQLRKQIRQSVKFNQQLIDLIKSNLTQQQRQNRPQSLRVETPYVNYPSINPLDKISQKHSYQLSIYKKQTQKLKQYCRQLQTKTKTKSNTVSSDITIALIQLSSQNQLLRQKCLQYQNQIEQLNQLYYQKLKIFLDEKNKEIKQIKNSGVNAKLLEKIVENQQKMISFTKKQDQFILKMSSAINEINKIMINPFIELQLIVNELKQSFSSCNVNHCDNKNHISYVGNLTTLNASRQTEFLVQKRQLYQEIISKKHQQNSMFQKSYSDFTQVLRELITTSSTKKSKKNTNNHDTMPVETDRPRFQQCKYTLQKRIKDIQTNRIKSRQQMLTKLKGLEQKCKNIEIKANRKLSFPFSRFQENICKKVQEILHIYSQSINLKELSKIHSLAMADLHSKLRESQVEKKGLVRQVELLNKMINHQKQ